MTRAAIVLALVSACAQSRTNVTLDDGGMVRACGPGLGRCPSGQLCDFPDDLCGDGEPGVCVEDIDACPEVAAPVCACNGAIASNACFASHDVDARGECDVAEGRWLCGFRECRDGEYCMLSTSERGTYYDCQPFTCAERGCACGTYACVGECATEAGRVVLVCD